MFFGVVGIDCGFVVGFVEDVELVFGFYLYVDDIVIDDE